LVYKGIALSTEKRLVGVRAIASSKEKKQVLYQGIAIAMPQLVIDRFPFRAAADSSTVSAAS